MIAPCQATMRPASPSATITRAAAIITGPSRRSAPARQASGHTSAAVPRINSTLAMFEPTTLPTASAGLPASAASRLTTSSGAVVP